ncbi:MAG: hypothetical protein ACT4PE_14675 [Candidatus Eiseniibacteriota bacterium]
MSEALAANARPRPARFALLLGQLALLLAAFHAYHVEGPVFFVVAVLCFGGFAVHYWLPVRLKEGFLILLSTAGAFLVLEPPVAALVLGFGVLVYGVTRLPFPFGVRLSVILLLGVAVVAARGLPDTGVPAAFWPTVGALFMFRLAVYLYELKHAKTPFGFTHFATYFFMLPNFYFLFFPVVDFQTMRQSFLRRNIHDVAQQGIVWLVRGTLQLVLYRIVVQLRGRGSPVEVTTLAALVQTMVLTYLLYLKVSGTFHIIVGMLHLFGYDLPETHRKWLLASSLTDFWRRINIYWKDFMVKMVYLPTYFRLRRSGDVRAQLIGTVLVFFVTWLTHAWQYWWLSGEWLLTLPDTLFWGTLGALVVVNVHRELRADRRRPPPAWPLRFAKTAGTFSLIVVLWSLWSSPTLAAWLELLTYGKIG